MPSHVEFINDLVQSCTAPVWFEEGNGAPAFTVKDNGSCGFVRSSSSRFLLTAKHVLDGFRVAKERNDETLFCVSIGNGNTVRLTEPVVIDEDELLDVATIDFPFLDQSSGHVSKIYYDLEEGAVSKASENLPVAIVGFPGQGRHGFETFGLFEPYPLNFFVSQLSSRRIVIEERDAKFVRKGQLLEEGILLGGFSGSPAFGVTDSKLILIGVVRQGDEASRVGCTGTKGYFFLGPTEFLLKDGHLDRTKTW